MEAFQESFSALNTQLTQLTTLQRDINTSFKGLQKQFKTATRGKKLRNVEKKVGPKLNLSKDLAKFLTVSVSTQMTKQEVMKAVSPYIKANKLQVEENKRKFKPDTKMSKIFGMKKSDQFSFVEINKHVSSHLSK